jgi:two-component system sensor histidine kinase KdpD
MIQERGRPDPEELLARVEEAERRSKGARFKIFIGASPGVGKTFAMLQEAHELKRAGLDVVAGVVETHGRPETAALLMGLEQLPRREIEYRDVRLEEFDLDAALARRPGLLLLDELAHTNAPGSRHAKRWQDVRDLLTAGIPVATTLNVQHVESLNDVVTSLTGVRVRETVPDSMLDRADEIELVDLPPDDLLKRLREGKVYIPEQARHAIENFFKKSNLIALRELVLRRTAERVGKERETLDGGASAFASAVVRDRILVCLGGPEEGPGLVRSGRRLADALHADWWVVHVENPAGLQLGEAGRQQIHDVMGFAEDLGAETAILSGHAAADEIAAFATARRIGRVLVGRSRRPRWRTLLSGTLAEALGRRLQGADIIVTDVEPTAGREGEPGSARNTPAPTTTSTPATTPAPGSGVGAEAWVRAIALIAACTVVGLVMRGVFERANIAMVYLLGVLLVAVTCGRGPSILASILAVATFDFLFVPPYNTFAVSDTEYIITFGVMLVTALVISTMANRLQEQARYARGREQRTAGLYHLSRQLAGAATPARVLEVGTDAVGDLLGAQVVALLAGVEGALTASSPLDERERAVAQWTFDHGEPAGRGTATLSASQYLYVPLATATRRLGVLGLATVESGRAAPDHLRLLRACADQIAVALERARLAREAEASRLQAESERMRSALLASVSHDLRTPLAVIQGAASELATRTAPSSSAEERELLGTVLEESKHLNRLVADLLHMTRLESGIELKRDWHSLEEIVGSALARGLPREDTRPVRTEIPRDLPLVFVDDVLMTQALIHLIENARVHTPPGTPIEITARTEGRDVILEVMDRGPGLPVGEEEKVFEKFHRRVRPSAASGDGGGQGVTPFGSGLGLAICRAIVRAHGGSISASSREDGGARFQIRLPRGADPPAVPRSEEAT